MNKIIEIKGREILDSRGNPTVQVDLIIDKGLKGRASVPSGASTGIREAVEIRDCDSRYLGKGVQKAVKNVNTLLNDSLKGYELNKQEDFDKEMISLDGTENKSVIGANAILGVSMAYSYASAKDKRIPFYKYFADISGEMNKNGGMLGMPVPMMNIINGGAHADNPIDIQEFMIMPVNFKSFKESLRAGAEIFHTLKSVLKKAGYTTTVGDEGGFAPSLSSSDEALSFIVEAIEKSGYKAGEDIYLALDVASSEFYKDGTYSLKGEGKNLNNREMVNYLESLCNKFPICSIEDGMAEEDWEGWIMLTEAFGNRIQLVGDDVFVTNPKIIKEGIEKKVANSVLIKPNQIGTITETISAINLAKENGYSNVVSHRSGETEDTIIADISVGTGATQIKTGSLSRSDRIAKYNRLLVIEEQLGDKAYFYGKDILKS